MSYITETLVNKIDVDSDFAVEVYQAFSKPFKDQDGRNITPRIKIIPRTSWAKDLFCEKHQQRTMDNYCCYKCEFED